MPSRPRHGAAGRRTDRTVTALPGCHGHAIIGTSHITHDSESVQCQRFSESLQVLSDSANHESSAFKAQISSRIAESFDCQRCSSQHKMTVQDIAGGSGRARGRSTRLPSERLCLARVPVSHAPAAHVHPDTVGVREYTIIDCHVKQKIYLSQVK